MLFSVEKLLWDSAFFKFPVGKILVPTGVTIDQSRLKTLTTDFKLVYLFSDELLPFSNNEEQLKLVDIKIIFEKNNIGIGQVSKPIFYSHEQHDYSALLELAYLSGIYSRFKLDDKFPRDSFQNLYKRWLDRGLENQDEYVIVVTESKFISGFVSVEIKAPDKAVIGLIAVNHDFRGKGIGSLLLRQAENLCVESGVNCIEVATQLENHPAMNLYEKNGYVIKKKIYIYHYWVK